MKPINSSWYLLGALYVAAPVALVFPFVGVPTGALLLALYKNRKKIEKGAREKQAAENRAEYREKFYSNQIYVSYAAYLQSEVWKEKRSIVMRRDNFRCQWPGCRSLAEEVHHKEYPRIWGQEPTDWLIALCRAHHLVEHGNDDGIMRG